MFDFVSMLKQVRWTQTSLIKDSIFSLNQINRGKLFFEIAICSYQLVVCAQIAARFEDRFFLKKMQRYFEVSPPYVSLCYFHLTMPNPIIRVITEMWVSSQLLAIDSSDAHPAPGNRPFVMQDKQKGSWETWLGPMAVISKYSIKLCMPFLFLACPVSAQFCSSAQPLPRSIYELTPLARQVNLRQLMHINLLYNASENNPTAVVSE